VLLTSNPEGKFPAERNVCRYWSRVIGWQSERTDWTRGSSLPHLCWPNRSYSQYANQQRQWALL